METRSFFSEQNGGRSKSEAIGNAFPPDLIHVLNLRYVHSRRAEEPEAQVDSRSGRGIISTALPSGKFPFWRT